MTNHADPLVLEQETLPADVKAHLATCARCRLDRRVLYGAPEPAPDNLESVLPEPSMLVRTWRSARAGSVVESTAPTDDVPPPKGLGPFVIDALLGAGGMAVVYRVLDRRSGEHHALKLLRRSDRELRHRLAREGRVQQELVHPNLVRVQDILEVGDSPALLLEYVAGPSLQEVLRDGPLPLDVVDRVATEILRGMGAAHRAGVIHRDLKPGNVLLAPVDSGFSAKVTDFGLARGKTGLDSLNTRTGAFAGTPLYMSPEQLRDASRADARSDVFSLGALLYELLTGIRAFAGVDYVDIVRRVADVRWAPVDQVRHGVPGRMVDAISAALQVDPADRPASADELGEIWAADTPDAHWPHERVLAGMAHHRPEAIEVLEQAPETNLTTYDDTYVARDEAREALVGHLERERLVTLTGPGGVGKTRLAVEVAHQIAFDWPGGVWFCDLTAARSVDGIAAAVADALGIGLEGNPIDAVGAALAARGKALVVLDNFEQVTEHAEATVEPWLEQAIQTHFVVTSREPLDLFEEVLLPLDILAPDAARALFLSRARRSVSDFEVDDGNREAIDQIVERLDGLPLAIEIVAARVRSRDVGRILSHLDRFRGDRHATLRTTLDGSWDLLEPAERVALLKMTVFESPADQDAVDAVLGDEARALGGLARRSLVRRAGERFRLLVPIRQWASGRLSASDRLAVERAHGAHFATADGDTADRVIDDLYVATERALERGDHGVATATGAAAMGILQRRGPIRRAQAVVASFLEHEGLPPLERAKWLRHQGRLRCTFGDSEQAFDELVEALELARSLGSAELEADAGNWAGIALHQLGRWDQARTYLHDALEISEREGLDQRVAFLNGALAVTWMRSGDPAKAREHFETSLHRHRALGNERGVALVLGDLGTLDLEDGHFDVARTRIVEAIEILARQNNPVEEAVGWHELADVHSATGQFEEARGALFKARELLQGAGASRREVGVLHQLGLLEENQGDLVAAGDALEDALALARSIGSRSLIGSSLQKLARLRRQQGSSQLADRLQAQADELELDDA